MRCGHSPIWIEIADLLLCVVGVVIVAVEQRKSKIGSVKPKAGFLTAANWPVALDPDVDP
ncbi:MAG TPA: hypothetical protein VMB83_05660 [Roseiarcus sp.]|nr:hypothetical protein [Roseiarcus sp.]